MSEARDDTDFLQAFFDMPDDERPELPRRVYFVSRTIVIIQKPLRGPDEREIR